MDEQTATDDSSADAQTNKPTLAVLILLIGVYSWLLTIAMHVFDGFFKNGPGSIKYCITLAIALASTLFMQVYGKHVVHQHFGTQGGRNLVLTNRQTWYVGIVVLCFGMYLAWLAS